jgi:midasin
VQFISVRESLSLVSGGKIGVFWRKVMIVPPNNEDLENIIKAWYPNLEPICKKLIGG